MQVDKVVDYISSWLADYVKKSGTKGFVIGVSGGIDSAVTSYLGALSSCQVLCLEMPIHQSQAQVKRASEHIDLLESKFKHVSRQKVELTQVFDSFIEAVPPVLNEEERFLALANTRARIRMSTLYYFAALKHALVLGTGNKIEDFGVGFFTKYGDGGVDLSPIADLTKSEVYALGDYLGINQEIMTAAPTDGLWGDDRSDEDQLGASYPELEWAMEFNGNESILKPREKEVLTIFRRLHAQNKHKMEAIPVCTLPAELRLP